MRYNPMKPSFGNLFQANTNRLINGRLERRQTFHTIHEGRHTWSVLKQVYQKQLQITNKKYACFLLNLSDKSHESFEDHEYIWNGASLKVAVDGSANYLAKRNLLSTADVISGDFDSINANLIQRLQSPRRAPTIKLSPERNTQKTKTDLQVRVPQIIETPSQKETDFTKAVHVAMKLRPEIQTFFALYYTDGRRMDHLFGLINTLHLIKKDIFILNIASRTISWLLQPGDHDILKPNGQELCSLVPFTGPTEVKTQGLLFNVNNQAPMKFGSLISTSNFCQPARDKIIVETKRELLWSVDMYRAETNN